MQWNLAIRVGIGQMGAHQQTPSTKSKGYAEKGDWNGLDLYDVLKILCKLL